MTFVAAFLKKQRGFETWLKNRGVTVLQSSDPDELLRASIGGKIALVVRGRGVNVRWTDVLQEAFDAYIGKQPWHADGPEAAAQLTKSGRPRKAAPAIAKAPTLPKGLERDGDGRLRVVEPGIYDLPLADYLADPCPEPSLSSSGAQLLYATCPQIYWHRRLDPEPASAAQRFGQAAHTWVLEGDTFEQRFTVLSGEHRRNEYGKAVEADIRGRGKEPIPARDWMTILNMKEALDAHPFAAAAFRSWEVERSLFWRHPQFGFWCRARPDGLPRPGQGRIMGDYKTASSVHPEELRRDIARYGYDQKAAWSIEGVKELGLIDRPQFAFVFQQSSLPHPIVVAALADAALVAGRMKNDRASALFARSLKSGVWSGYADDVVELDLPAWEHKRLEIDSGRGLFDVAAIFQSPLTPRDQEKAA